MEKCLELGDGSSELFRTGVPTMHYAPVIDSARSPLAADALRTNIKNILLHVQNEGSMDARFEIGLSLARATGAHLQCVHVTPIEAYVTLEAFGLFGLDRAMREIDLAEDQLRARLEKHLGTEDVAWDYVTVAGYTASELIRRAALCDLVITSRAAHKTLVQRPELAILGEVLKSCRTPLLVPGTLTETIDWFGTAIVAWNGSFEAANAVRAAIDLLKLASDVRVVRYTEDKDVLFPDTQLTQYLSRHDVHAELDVRPVHQDFSDDLIEYASRRGGSYIVMGGYGHSRAGEFLFGGVTRELLRDCPVSLVIAH